MIETIKQSTNLAMDVFKTLLFGVAGLSVIFWTAVIGLWHVDMFPRFFKEDRSKDLSGARFSSSASNSDSSLMDFERSGALRPSMQASTGLFNRDKYSRRGGFVVADFSPLENGYGVNRLYTSILLALAVISFVILTYGLHSAFMNFV
tara:strand:- start:240 stop:683 length:444 start_codon:yes stop_codon:yes gene_type:complete